MIMATNSFSRYKNQRHHGNLVLNAQNAVKKDRDKRTQVISYLTAEEASAGALSRFIEVHALNKFSLDSCGDNAIDQVDGEGDGLRGWYYDGKGWKDDHYNHVDTVVNFSDPQSFSAAWPHVVIPVGPENFSVRWTGRIKAPLTGTYVFIAESDDASELFINNEQVIDNRGEHPVVAARDT